MDTKYALCIPTYNAGALWENTLKSIDQQTIKGLQKIIVDSGSSDNTVDLAKTHGFTVIEIAKVEFNHGKTRQLLVNSCFAECEICVFLTQDAILSHKDSLRWLLNVFDDQNVGLAYGRQLPREGAKPLEAHLRTYNYPALSNVRSAADINKLGFKVFFCSNSFAAYRKSALNKVGGFPSESIMGEDAIVGAKMIKAGLKIAYVAEASVYHSHDYTAIEEFKRYFDTRVFHEQNDWLIKEYGKPTGEGLKFVKSELKFALSNNPGYLLKSIASIVAKWFGYKAGAYYKKIPFNVVRKISMHKHYWK